MKNRIRFFMFIMMILSSIFSGAAWSKYIVVIDAGHGGNDPGAIGPNKLYEKKVTLAIAQKVQALAKNDPNIEIKLTRNKDVYLSVAERSEIARKFKANLLVSIHADAITTPSVKGASVWILSNKRAKTELGRWLEQHEKQSELLGGAGNALAQAPSDPHLSEAILDLQFAHASKVSGDLATLLLQDLGQQTQLNKLKPQYASLGVLRSPDIPSVLIEVGFISNPQEEKLLATSAFQQKIAQSIYNGIKRYVRAHVNPASLK